MKKILSALLLAFAVAIPAAATTVVVTGNNVQYPLSFPFNGQWCFGATCGTVTNGSFNVSVSSGTATVTFVSGSTVVLSIPNVTLSGTAFNWNTYTLPVGTTATGNGYPTIPCTVGALYVQNNSNPPYSPWSCQFVSGTATWINGPPPNIFKSGSYAGAGVPTFYCAAPCRYTQTDAVVTSAADWLIVAQVGIPSTNWVRQGGGGVVSGATFTVTGCGTPTSTSGGPTAGSFTALATSCTAVITTGITAPHGYSCYAADLTTTSDSLKQTASTTTTVTISGTVASSDVINFGCTPF